MSGSESPLASFVPMFDNARMKSLNTKCVATVMWQVLLLAAVAANIPVSTAPPGGLDPSDTPQICLFTFDDTVTSNGYPIIQSVLTNHVNPNGSPIQATFYVNTDNGQYFNARLVEQLYAQGHEIGVHTMTHTTSTNTTVETWRREIVGCRKIVSDLSLVPKEEIVGFRAPYLEFSQGSFDILAEAGFRYDTSIREATGNGGLSSSNSAFIWPYTLDNGVQQECVGGDCPEENYPGLFEVPLWVLDNTNGETLATMDVDFVNHPEWSADDVMTLLTNNFLAHYNGNRAPFGVYMHATWTNQWFVSEPWHSQVVSDFIGWALDQPDVWFVSTKALLDFMEDPQTATNAYTFEPFITSTNHHLLGPEEEVTERAYPDYGWKRIVTSVDPPYLWPRTNTFYAQWQTVNGGSAANWITSWGDQFAGHITVSNSTDYTVYKWEATFHVEHGEITNFWGTPFTVTNDLYTAYSHDYNMPVPPHTAYTNRDTGAETMGFGGILDGVEPATISPAQLTLYTFAMPIPAFTNMAVSSSSNLMLAWEEAAVGYSIESTTNLVAGNWSAITTIYTRTEWTSGVPDSASPTFYRIRSVY